jgi:4'-phosphopantetheinyl transferase
MPAGAAWIEIAPLARVLAEAPPDTARWLSESEQARLAALRHAGRRAQFVAGHWLVRVLLARAWGEAPAQWSLCERRSRAPSVRGHESLQVSISHADAWIAAAVADAPIGIDLEPRGRRLDDAIAPLLVNAGEDPASLDAQARLERWVAKEAWLKRADGSALPARLERLQLRAVAHAEADVRLERSEAFVFGLALAPDCRVTCQCELALEPGTAFAITEFAG